MADIALCLVITKTLLAAWALLSAAEWFANLPLFRSDGLLTWNILRLRPRLLIPASIRHRMHAESTVIAVLTCRIAAGLLLLIPYSNPADLPCSLLILLSCFYMSRRTWFGGDGSDQMGMIVAAGVAIISAGLVLDDMNLAASGVFAISGQAVLAYFIAGAAKVVSPIWRDGKALPGVMKTRTYGHSLAAGFAAEQPAFCKFVCWLTIGTEMLFPLVLLAPPGVAIASLCCFALFHFSNAYFMGLNAFVWPFLATYPAVMLANSAVRNWMGWA